MVYIIEAISGDESIFKIGTTANCPYKRLNQLQRQNAVPLRLVGALIGTRDDEKVFHHAFRKFRLHGEWFKDCRAIRELIADFPVWLWDEYVDKLKYGEVEFREVFNQMTLLRFEPREDVRHAAFSEAQKLFNNMLIS